MSIAPNTLDLIGNTPMVRLEGPSAETGCTILGKCEYANPGASVKDRAALFIVEDAEARGVLKPGGTIVEGTAGNTGIGIALVANAKGYRTIIVMPDTQSREKMDTLRALGAELVLVPPAPFANPGHFVHTSRRIAEETAREEGKPEASLSKIIEGRVTGFVKEVSLIEQAFAKDAKKTVKQILDEAGTAVKAFHRFRVGQ